MLRVAVLAVLLVAAVPVHAGLTDGLAGAQEAAASVQQDPQASVSDPEGLLSHLVSPGDAGSGDGGRVPREGADPGFADRIRAAFHDEMVVAGMAALAVTALGLAGFALVTRFLTPKEALQNPQRAMLYGFVRGNPGVHLKKLSEEFGMKTSSILWHVRKLEAAQLVRSERANGFRVFYPTEGGMAVKLVSRASTALQNHNARALFEVVDSRPGASAPDLAAQSGIPAGTVRWHLRKLKDFGLVEELERGGLAIYFGTPLGHRALQALHAMPESAASATASAA